jgi:hypothetical protein
MSQRREALMRRVVALAVICTALLVAGVRIHLASAQESTPEPCIGRLTPEGLEFGGSGSLISEPFAVSEGALFANVEMSAAGAVKLMNAAGDTILLGNAAEPFQTVEAVSVREADDFYLVVDFYSEEGDWSLVVEQPAG